ncbi:toprim domain-containing protein [Streptomyces sp. H27-G5]|uniref:toprim domain-containing protein n=1 Tax=Streptomyces sp. H27-G5 TaxID=2996698 RepID=UPI00226E828A|nr:toprim domain-containing protein [Streptomyces sp. H27-G5]MCY0923662.1 toprim domain-containing protein [Streptomyces sp. H27-G5]
MLLKSSPPSTSLVEIAQSYSLSFPGSPAAEYIRHRGLDSIATRMGLGYVEHPATGHEKQGGRLAIPYLRPAGGEYGVATIRFRCIAERCTKHPDGTWRDDEDHEGHGKYQSLPGSKPMLYNTQALIRPSPCIGISEGEFDSMASEIAEIPCAGSSGVSSWRDHFDPAFLGYERVFGFTDGDGPGEQFIAKLAERLPNLVPIYFEKKYDVCRFVNEFGPQALREKCGLS